MVPRHIPFVLAVTIAAAIPPAASAQDLVAYARMTAAARPFGPATARQPTFASLAEALARAAFPDSAALVGWLVRPARAGTPARGSIETAAGETPAYDLMEPR